MSSVRNKIAITGYLQVDGRKALCVPNAMGKNTAELVLEDYTNAVIVIIRFL